MSFGFYSMFIGFMLLLSSFLMRAPDTWWFAPLGVILILLGLFVNEVVEKLHEN